MVPGFEWKVKAIVLSLRCYTNLSRFVGASGNMKLALGQVKELTAITLVFYDWILTQPTPKTQNMCGLGYMRCASFVPRYGMFLEKNFPLNISLPFPGIQGLTSFRSWNQSCPFGLMNGSGLDFNNIYVFCWSKGQNIGCRLHHMKQSSARLRGVEKKREQQCTVSMMQAWNWRTSCKAKAKKKHSHWHQSKNKSQILSYLLHSYFCFLTDSDFQWLIW